MSVIPWFDDFYRPASRRCDRSTGICCRESEDYMQVLPRSLSLFGSPLDDLRNLSSALQDTRALIASDKDKFLANIDVQQFKPEEISVKVTGDNTVTIEGKHEEKADEHGYISRHFVRKYTLPESCDVKNVQSKLSSDGVLTITAPKVGKDKKIQHIEIPITRTGPQQVKRVEANEEVKK